MAGVYARRMVLCALVVLAATMLVPSDTHALEALDGKIQAHGFGEMQMRAMSRSFEEEVDLAQWYNVLNVELEFDIAPDGWGPFDLLSAYVRLEGRYDCIYSSGCGAFPSIRTWGDRSRALPLRLRDARDDSYGGAIETNDFDVPTGRPSIHPDRDPFGWAEIRSESLPILETHRVIKDFYNPLIDNFDTDDTLVNGFIVDGVVETSPGVWHGTVCGVNNRFGTCPDNRPDETDTLDRQGFPGFDTLFRIQGADGEVGAYTDYNQSEMPPSGFNPVTGVILTDEGQREFQALTFETDDPAVYTLNPVLDWKFVARSQRAARGGAQTKLMGPWLPKNSFQTLATLSDRANPFRGRTSANTFPRAAVPIAPSHTTRAPNIRYHELDHMVRNPDGTFTDIVPTDLAYAVDAVDPRLLAFNALLAPGSTFEMGPDPNAFVYGFASKFFDTSFGGDYSGIVPCFEPLAQASPRFTPTQWSFDSRQKNGHVREPSCIPFTNIRVTGGTGELPFRPSTDLQNLASLNKTVAQGLYIPSAGLVNYLKRHDKDSHDMNISESNRSFNRGQSQQSTYELKEAYLDMEFLDSRLWIRAGKQNIVWGKTELFRTTDQFNPQDLALANLPSLEESRIGLLSARAVWSFYDVGPLEDVRFEMAANFDSFQPADLGACGEPFAFDIVCQLSLGLALHGVLGVGIVGMDRPDSAWKDVDGIEYGGRLEFRWDRFSFAITDFYGYQDTPSIRPVSFFERNVDPNSGRPRAFGETGPCENAAGFLQRGFLGTTIAWNATNFRLWGFGFGDASAGASGSSSPANWRNDYSRNLYAMTLNGVGIDPACLKPGGAANQAAQNGLDVLLVTDPDDFPGAYNVPAGNITPIPFGNLATASFITSLLGSDPTQPGADPTALDGPWNIAPGQAVDTDGDGMPDQIGASPQNALQYQPANLQLFTVLCSATTGIVAALSPGACGFNVFGISEDLNSLLQVPLSELFTTIFAGEVDQDVMKFMRAIQEATRGSNIFISPITPLNMDVMDGRTTASEQIFINPIRNVDQAMDGNPLTGGEDLLTMDRTLTAEQRALLGCGPFYGTRCDSGRAWGIFPEGGGIDVLNAEASVILQSFPGVEGSEGLGADWTTTSTLAQPGTIMFANRVVGTRYFPSSPLADALGLVTLPGARGAIDYRITADEVQVVLQSGYNPQQDGCTFGQTIDGRAVRAYNADFTAEATFTQFLLDSNCNSNSKSRFAAPGNTPYRSKTQQFNFARTLWHPAANCEVLGAAIFDPLTFSCRADQRSFEQEFIAGNAQIFRNEMAAWSWNFMVFLVETSCNSESGGDEITDPDCFNPRLETRDADGNPILFPDGTPDQQQQALKISGAWSDQRCSLGKPYLCRNVKAFLNLGGVGRNVRRAGGTREFGRRDFLWHSGGELVLRYARRNVFGFSADFAEDYSKTNWGMEFTYFGEMPFQDSDSNTNASDSGTLNLTISVDRPTFINFLNANRTFFFNSQWFFQYLTGYEDGFTTNGPFNVLFTFAVFTGYFQDRFLPTMVTVYDFNSRSGGFLPSVAYRFTEAFSVTIGSSFFIGSKQLVDMPINGFAPRANRAAPHKYKDPSEQLLTNFMNRDEVYVRLRWTF